MDSSAFVRGLNQAKARTAEFSQTVRTSLSGVTQILGGIGVGSLAYGIGQSAQNLSTMLDLARKSDTDFKRFQELSQIFRESGSSTEQFADTLAKVIKNTGEAQRGTKTYTDAFNQLNIQVDRFAQESPDEMILQLADAWNRSSKSAQDFNALITIMGRAATNLRQTLDVGREGIEETGRSIATISKESVEKIKTMEAALLKFKTNTQVAGGEIVATLARLQVPNATGSGPNLLRQIVEDGSRRVGRVFGAPLFNPEGENRRTLELLQQQRSFARGDFTEAVRGGNDGQADRSYRALLEINKSINQLRGELGMEEVTAF